MTRVYIEIRDEKGNMLASQQAFTQKEDEIYHAWQERLGDADQQQD